jgi:hypothetical protein
MRVCEFGRPQFVAPLGALCGCGRAEINHACRLGLLLTFQPESGRGRVVRAASEAFEQALRQDDLSVAGGGLQTRRGVHYVADGGEVLDLAGADVTDIRSPDVEPDAELKPRPGRSPIANRR